MAYAGIQMFMEKLNQLINCNDVAFFNKRRIIRERPQFQLFYDELDSMIQTLYVEEHQNLHDIEKLIDLKQRFIYAAEKAEYILDMFLSGVHIKNNGNLSASEDFNPSLNLDDVRRSFKTVFDLFLSCVHIRSKLSLKLDDVRRSFKSVKVEYMKMDSSRKNETENPSDAAPISSPRCSLGSNKLLDEIVVGFDRDAELIRDKLVEDQKKLDIVSIVGMGGIGKTTLAAKVFNDGYVKHHFYVRVWVTVSQAYNKRAVLIQILNSIRGQLNLEKTNDSQLREMVHKNLMGKRYLIVIDDIWNIETWDNLKLFFLHDNNGSRILLTSRLTEVAKHANSDGLIHHLGYLNKAQSLELLRQKVFHGNKFPKWSYKRGMQIVKNCQGLPLAVVVIAGVLAKDACSEKFWVKIAESTGSYIVSDQNGCLETLSLSYNHLPLYLRECFLYLGGFPEDYMFKVQRLIWLWVAEGFIQQDQDGNRSLEDIAEGYLMNLIDRNLVIVVDRKKSNGGVKACKVHDLVRELCLRKSKEERFILLTETLISSPQFSDVITQPYKPVRLFINKDINILGFPYSPALNSRSIVCFSDFRSLSDVIANGFRSFELLRVLDLQNCRLNDFPKGVELLVHLRYLAIWKESEDFPSSLCNLWGLQTLIYLTYCEVIHLPSNISDLVNLRHLYSDRSFFLDSIEKPMNLQTISYVKLGDGLDNLQECFAYVKELKFYTCSGKQNDFKSLTYLENLELAGDYGRRMGRTTFPASLKTLTLGDCYLPWSFMSIIQSLCNLRVLNLEYAAFKGNCWNTDEQEFRQLNFLRLHMLDIEQWKANSRSFPCLRQLEIIRCYNLEEIPLEIGNIPTLELIQIKYCCHFVKESVRKIEEEQHDFGNFDLKIDIFED